MPLLSPLHDSFDVPSFPFGCQPPLASPLKSGMVDRELKMAFQGFGDVGL
jgi:hypothetical protein